LDKKQNLALAMAVSWGGFLYGKRLRDTANLLLHEERQQIRNRKKESQMPVKTVLVIPKDDGSGKKCFLNEVTPGV